MLQIGRSLVRFQLVSGFFIDIKSFRSHYGPGVDLASNRVPGVFPGGKGGRCVRLTTYHHPVPLSRNLGTLTSWNPLGLSRPVMGLIFIVNDMGCHTVHTYVLYLVYVLHWPDDGCFTAETCSADVIDISSLC